MAVIASEKHESEAILSCEKEPALSFVDDEVRSTKVSGALHATVAKPDAAFFSATRNKRHQAKGQVKCLVLGSGDGGRNARARKCLLGNLELKAAFLRVLSDTCSEVE